MNDLDIRSGSEEIYSTIDESFVFPLYIRYTSNNANFHNKTQAKSFEEFIAETSGVHDCFFIHRRQKGKQGKVYEEVSIKIGDLPICITAQASRDEMTLREPKFSLKNMVVPDEPEQYIGKKCLIKFVDLHEDTFKLIREAGAYWLNHTYEISTFLKQCFTLPVPQIEIRIDDDKEMWQAYLDGLNAILENKRDLIKIQKISKQKGGLIRLDFDMNSYDQNLKRSISDILSVTCQHPAEITIEDGVCLINFNSYQAIPDDTIDDIKSLCRDYCYSPDTVPQNLVTGRIALLVNEEELSDVTNSITQELKDFGVDFNKNEDGQFILKTDSDIEFLRKIVETHHSGVAEVIPTTRLVMPLFPSASSIDVEEIRANLPEDCKMEQFGKHYVVSTRKPLDSENPIFNSLRFVSCMVTITPSTMDESVEIEGATIKNNAYSWIVDNYSNLSTLGKLFNKVRIRYSNQYITSSYKYAFLPQVSKEYLQQLKLNNYGNQSLIVNVPSRSISFIPRSLEEYQNLIKLIFEQLDDNISASEPVYIPTAKIEYLTENEEYRKGVFEKVNLALADKLNRFSKNKLSKDSKSLSFEFSFNNIEERDEIEHILSSSLEGIHGLRIVYDDNNSKGITQWTLSEDLSLLQEVNRKLQSDYWGEIVNYINGKEYDKQSDLVDDEVRESRISPERIIKKRQISYIRSSSFRLGTCNCMTRSYAIIEPTEETRESLKLKELKIDKGDYIQFPAMGETMELMRQSIAMNRILRPEGKFNRPPINANLPNFIFDPKYAGETVVNILEHMDKIRAHKIGNLNEKQLEAVTKSVLAQDLALIQGPPGTGKTTVIAEIIWQIIRENPDSRILITSQTNLAVDNALERLQSQAGIRPVRIGKAEKLEPEGRRFSLSVMDSWAGDNSQNSDNATKIWMDRIANKVSNDPKYATAVKSWKNELQQKDKHSRLEFGRLYKSNVNLVAATCSICGSRDFLEAYADMFGETDKSEMYFDVVIMDEASKATPLEMAVPLVLGKKIIVIGDHKQLPPMMDENTIDSALDKIGKKELSEKLQNAESQFKRLFESAAKVRKSVVSTLDTQYRMHEDIMNTIKQFYEEELAETGGLKCGITESMDIPDLTNKGSRWHGINLPPIISPQTHALWIDVTTPETALNPGFKNEGELEAVDLVIKALQQAEGYNEFIEAQKKPEDKELGIITFYSAQSREIKRRYKDRGYRMDVVDRFQGMERNIIIVSTVRSNSKNNIGFAKEIERINVAFSRARRLLIVVGNKSQFQRNSNYAASIANMQTVTLSQLRDAVK